MTDGYTAVYGSDEVDEPIIDIIVAVGAFLVGFGSLIALILLWKWIKKRK
jgi:hypothetical protein